MPRSRRDDLTDFVRELYEGHIDVDGAYDWLPDALYEYTADVETAAVHQHPEPPILVDYAGAARLLKTTVAALKSRVSRGDNKLNAAMVTNGRSVRFSVAKLTERFTPKGRP